MVDATSGFLDTGGSAIDVEGPDHALVPVRDNMAVGLYFEVMDKSVALSCKRLTTVLSRNGNDLVWLLASECCWIDKRSRRWSVPVGRLLCTHGEVDDGAGAGVGCLRQVGGMQANCAPRPLPFVLQQPQRKLRQTDVTFERDRQSECMNQDCFSTGPTFPCIDNSTGLTASTSEVSLVRVSYNRG